MTPLAETSRRSSPYGYALNNPVYFIDPDEMEAEGFKSGDANTTSSTGETETASGTTESKQSDVKIRIIHEYTVNRGYGLEVSNRNNVASFNSEHFDVIDSSKKKSPETNANLSNSKNANTTGNQENPKKKEIKKEPWDFNGNGKLEKGEADFWFYFGGGATINIDNNLIDWEGLTMPLDTEIGGQFAIETHAAFIDLPYETASTFGGTSFRRTGNRSAQVIDQLYHYDLRPNNSLRNFGRNIMNEIGKPVKITLSNGLPQRMEGVPFMIHYINPTIRFKQ